MSKLYNICGKEIPGGEEFEMDGQILCHDCFDDLYMECADCGAIHPREELTQVVNGDFVCDECLDRCYVRCEDCGEWISENDAYTVNPGCHDERTVCVGCLEYGDYYRCDHCSDYFTDNHIWATDDHRSICDDCSDHYYICADCGSIIHADYTYWHPEDAETPRCEACYDDYESRHGNRAIHDYGYKPYPIFGTTDSFDGRSSYSGDELTFGVELECDKGNDPSDAAENICSLTDRVYCKHDGSLDYGYEIVTHPGTLAWHMQVFPWEKICAESIAFGFKSHDAGTCGLHIHIGRNQLGGDRTERIHTVANMILLTDVLWPEIVRFSRRTGESRWANRNRGVERLDCTYPVDEETAARDVLRDSENSGRYLAVNVQNSGTVELRFNRGTLVPRTIFACLQLASNLTMFAKEHTIDECLDAKWEDVVHYHEYDALNGYVNDRFSGWAPDCGRPSTQFRVHAQHEPMTFNADDPFGFDARCKLVTAGAIFEPANTEPQLGDLVVLTREENTFLRDTGPRPGSIGVCVEDGGGGTWPLFMWNDVECHDLHDGGDEGLANRCYFVDRSDVRIIRSYEDGARPNRSFMLRTAREQSLVPGDLVHARDSGQDIGILYALGGNGLDAGYVAWKGHSFGHDGINDRLRDTQYRRHGWNYTPCDLSLAQF